MEERQVQLNLSYVLDRSLCDYHVHPLTDTGERTGGLRTVLPLLHHPSWIQNGRGRPRSPPPIPGTSHECVAVPISRSDVSFEAETLKLFF